MRLDVQIVALLHTSPWAEAGNVTEATKEISEMSQISWLSPKYVLVRWSTAELQAEILPCHKREQIDVF